MKHETHETAILPKRPLIFLSDIHKAIEQCFFFYERGILPLIGEPQNPAVTLSIAKQYGVDAILVDKVIFEKFKTSILESGFDPKSIIIVENVRNLV